MASLAEISVRFTSNLKDFSSRMQNATRDLDKVGRKMQRTGRTLTTGLTLPIIAAGAAASKLALDFDTNMTKVQTLVGVSEDKVRGFRKEVLKLSGTTAKAPAELASALFTVTSAGLRGAEAMEVLESAAKASTVGLGETTEVARATTAVIQAYGKENITAARATDILTATVREGNLEASELAPVLGRVIGLASQLGIPFEEVGASIATFTRLGVDSAEAVTGLRGVMNALIKPTSAGSEALSKYGLTFAKLREEVKEKGLANTLIKLVKTFKGNEEALGAIIPNVRALSTALGTAGAQSSEYQRIVESLTKSQGILDEAFEATTKTAGFKLKKALADLKVVGTQFGDIILPVIADLAKRISTLFDGLKKLNPATKTMVVRIAAVAAIVGPTVLVIGKMISVVYAAAKAVRVLSLAMATNPIGIAAVAIGALALAFGAFKSSGVVFRRETEQITTDLQKQKTEVNSLVGAINRQGVSESERLELIKKLKKEYPDFLKGINAEKATTQDLEKSLKNFNDEFERKIALEANEESLKSLVKSISKEEERLKGLRNINTETEDGLKLLEKFKMLYFTDEDIKKGVSLDQVMQQVGWSIETSSSHLQKLKDNYNEVLSAAVKLKKEQENGVLITPFQEVDVDYSDRFISSNNKIVKSWQKIGQEIRSVNKEMIQAAAQAKTMAIKIVDPLRDVGKEFQKISNLKSVFPSFDDTGAKIEVLKSQITELINSGVNPAAVSVRNLSNQLNNLVDIQRFQETSQQLTAIFTNVFDSMLNSGEGVIKSLIRAIGGLIKKLIAAAAAAFVVRTLLGDIGAGSKVTAGASSFISSISGLLSGGVTGGSRASGGPVSAGLPYRVLEHGKSELFVPNTSGRIYPMSQVQNRSEGATGGRANSSLVAVVRAGDLHFILQNYERSLGRMGI